MSSDTSKSRSGSADTACAEAVAALFARRRKGWLTAFKRCRKRTNERNVHEVRVQSRRLMAMLRFVGLTLPAARVAEVEERARAAFKSFSRLRDNHVQLDLAADLARSRPEARLLARHLQKREKRLLRQLERDLEEHGRRELVDLLRSMECDLEEAGGRVGRRRITSKRLLAAVEAAFRRVRHLRDRVDAADTGTLHAVRVAFKKFRYMVEVLGSVLQPLAAGRMRAMHAYQMRLGEIQDLDMLLKQIAKFALKHPDRRDAMRSLVQVVTGRRDARVQKFLAGPDGLAGFWPLPANRRRGANKRRRKTGHGSLSSATRHRR